MLSHICIRYMNMMNTAVKSYSAQKLQQMDIVVFLLINVKAYWKSEEQVNPLVKTNLRYVVMNQSKQNLISNLMTLRNQFLAGILFSVKPQKRMDTNVFLMTNAMICWEKEHKTLIILNTLMIQNVKIHSKLVALKVI